MTDETLQALLSDYAAPIADDGFSDVVMAALPAKTFETTKRAFPWRGALVSLCLGGVVGMAWNRAGEALSGLSMPEIDPSIDLASVSVPLENGGIMLLVLGAVVLAGWLALEISTAY